MTGAMWWVTAIAETATIGLGGSMTDEERRAIGGRSVVLFDGRCGLCNGVVRFVIERDRGGEFRYVPQESALGGELMGLAGVEVGVGELADGVILVEDALGPSQRVWVRSGAVARAMRLLGGAWAILGGVFGGVPEGLREWGYGLVARWRYRLFGRYAVCPLPTAAERGMILGVGG